ncbi:bifunctional methylenetetrahydrofolate dehydrogenase/methenyltetrahydrofolate cyclohydrolase [Actinokineospora iranica]|uniref:5,10-methylenetetrahydrofolate dehydrogenase (NAD+) n=1 Tax=Actinokineospora iranica TaxID=1271860 RepID=A0A1G6KB71_9PSEU|nr:bifunctional methylenetetrahydrofolate dehydrogenase/methenyltetrahydrofolate cyclohydrolase [Actinokineospora iranica]SDC28214.1 5,10-methylenetetrahydrofolate dehydrogenase (NAD+) [Actinokineospora iranica]
MTARILDPAALAEAFRAEIRADVAQIPEPLTLAGFLVDDHGPSKTYADYTRRGCESVGIAFDLRVLAPADVERAVRDAGNDDRVHGLFVYYPVNGPERDRWLRELVDPRKDVEGLHSFWSRCLYENRRFIDAERTKRALLPCTPLAILKLVEDSGITAPNAAAPLSGLRACVFNRSEIVGKPLAAMMANDGATVTSFDADGPQLFLPDSRDVHDVDVDRATALAEADIVVTGVPSRDFPLVRPDEIKPGAICVNFSTLRNFAENITDTAGAFAPRVGPMTVTMALRNLVRLYRNTRA